jgi:hypothetical protein
VTAFSHGDTPRYKTITSWMDSAPLTGRSLARFSGLRMAFSSMLETAGR